jgi:hypothetical protein
MAVEKQQYATRNNVAWMIITYIHCYSWTDHTALNEKWMVSRKRRGRKRQRCTSVNIARKESESTKCNSHFSRPANPRIESTHTHSKSVDILLAWGLRFSRQLNKSYRLLNGSTFHAVLSHNSSKVNWLKSTIVLGVLAQIFLATSKSKNFDGKKVSLNKDTWLTTKPT